MIVMSTNKRNRGIKDYGRLIPGHGDMMDRIDSLCCAALCRLSADALSFITV